MRPQIERVALRKLTQLYRSRHRCHPIRFNQIVHGRRAATADTVLRLSRYFGPRPGWWMDLQSHFDLETAADRREARIPRALKPSALLVDGEPARA